MSASFINPDDHYLDEYTRDYVLCVCGWSSDEVGFNAHIVANSRRTFRHHDIDKLTDELHALPVGSVISVDREVFLGTERDPDKTSSKRVASRYLGREFTVLREGWV